MKPLPPRLERYDYYKWVYENKPDKQQAVGLKMVKCILLLEKV